MWRFVLYVFTSAKNVGLISNQEKKSSILESLAGFARLIARTKPNMTLIIGMIVALAAARTGIRKYQD
jgi:hypothetical protein